MSEPYVGEIRLFPYPFAPRGWLACDGSLLQVRQYTTLFSLLGTTYGGNGVTTFGLPDLRGRVPLHQGAGTGLTPRQIGSTGGTEAVALTTAQLGSHNHPVTATATTATLASPAGAVLAAPANGDTFYAPDASGQATAFAGAAIQPAGSGAAHDNTAPTLAIQYCICLQGIYPSRP